MMDFDEFIQAMTPDIYHNMKTAVELGKWPDGSLLNQQQRETAMQAVMVYDALHSSPHDEPFRVQPDGSMKLGKGENKSMADVKADIIVKSQL